MGLHPKEEEKIISIYLFFLKNQVTYITLLKHVSYALEASEEEFGKKYNLNNMDKIAKLI